MIRKQVTLHRAPPPAGRQQPAPRQPARSPQQAVPRARTISIIGAKDGVGKSVFATNIAISFLRETKRRVLLIDLDWSFCGDIKRLLGLPEVKSLTEIAPFADRLDPSILRGFITPHQSGIGVMQLYRDKNDLKRLSPDLFARVLDLLGSIFDFILVDGGTNINAMLIKAIERSTVTFIMATPDLLGLHQTKLLVDKLQSLHFPKEVLKVILNCYEPRNPVTLDIVTQKLQRQVLTTVIRDDALVRDSMLAAVPFVLGQPRATLTRNYDEFVRNLIERKILDALQGIRKPMGVTLGPDAESGEAGEGAATFVAEAQKEMKSWLEGRSKRRAGRGREMDARTALKLLIHKRLLEVLDLKKLDADLKNHEEKDRILRERTERAIVQILDQEGKHITSREERGRIVKEVLDEALGLGPLEDLLNDPTVTEVMVNGRDQVYVERAGKLQLTDITFTDDTQLLAVIERIVAPLGRRIDEKSPMVDARLKDGSRVNAIIPPLAIDGAALTIRKFSKDPLGYKDLIRFGSMTDEIADFLRACIEARLNVIISGGTGSGKTTLLNVLSSFIPPDERIVTVEDSAELQLSQPHVVRLETRPPNIEGVGEITIRDLVRNCLRMRPDRIVVGECRGGEALDMLQAMNTGHDGSLTTIHANSPRDALSRLETLIMFAGLELPSKAIREQIASAIHIIVQQGRLADGSRKIVKISEVTGLEGQTITLQDIFLFKQTGVDKNRRVIGKFVPTGFIPKFIEGLSARGISIPKGLFRQQL